MNYESATWEHHHINTFSDNPKDPGRNNVIIKNFGSAGRHVENIICHVFDESIQRHVEVIVHWQHIMDFMERRQPLELGPATIEGVIWYDKTRSFAKSWSKWNPDRGTWELDRIGAGAYGDLVCLRFEENS